MTRPVIKFQRFSVIAIWACSLIGVVCAAETTEFRRALLIGNNNAALESALKKRGFLISKGKISDFLPGSPHNGFNLIYYLGELENREGGWYFASDNLLVKDMVAELTRKNITRHNVLILDLQNKDDNSRKELPGILRGFSAQNNERGLGIINKSAAKEDSLSAQLTKWLLKPETDLRTDFAKTAFVSAETQEFVILRGDPAVAISSPEKLIKGRAAGDQWLAPDGMNFVWCPSGKYTMGDTSFYDTQPILVVIEKGFWISKFELTRLDASSDRLNVGGSFTYGRQLTHPAGAVRVETLLEQLRAKKGPKGWTYDLPTEAEWEYAARADSTESLPSPIEKLGQFVNFADLSLYNARKQVHFIFAHQKVDDGTAHGFANIGQYLPNAWGIHDMFGNASEYCAGYYGEELTGKVNYHLETWRDRGIPVLRGGAWCTPVENLHVAYRTGYNGDENQPYAGARLVIRQGERVTRMYKNLVKAKKDEEAAAKKRK